MSKLVTIQFTEKELKVIRMNQETSIEINSDSLYTPDSSACESILYENLGINYSIINRINSVLQQNTDWRERHENVEMKLD